MNTAFKTAALAIVLTFSAGAASAQSAAQDQALRMSDHMKSEMEQGFAEFQLASTSGNTQDAVCPHLANGVEHFIAANTTSNNLIQYLHDNRLFDAEAAAGKTAGTVVSTANGAIDLYRKNCNDWVDTRRK